MEPPDFVREIGTSGTGDGRFERPCDVAMTSDGSIYVADINDHLIQRFDPDGGFVWEISAPGSRAQGSGEGEFSIQSPRGVAVASNGSVYVTDYGNDRIQVFVHSD